MSDPIDDQPGACSKDDLVSVSGGLLKQINWKTALYLFVIGIIIFSDIFTDHVLNKIPDSTNDGIPNTKGSMFQLLLLILAFLILDLLVKNDWI